MAASRSFTAASTSYLETTTVPAGINAENKTFSLGVWYKPATLQNGTVFGLGKTGGSGYVVVGMLATGKAFAEPNSGTDSTSTASLTTGVWHHIGAKSTGTKLTVYLDGVAGTEIAIGTNTGLTALTIGGVVINGSRTSFQKGEVAHAAAWAGVALTTAQFKELFEGKNPHNLEVAKLVSYYPLTSESLESYKGEFGAKLTAGAAAGMGTSEPTVESAESGTKANATVAKLIALGAVALGPRKQTGEVAKAVDIANVAAPSRKQTGAVPKVVTIGNVGATVRAQSAAVGKDVAAGAAPAPSRKQSAAVGRDVASGLAPTTTLKLAATAAVVKVLGMAPTASGRASALAAAALARVLGATPTARRSQSPFAAKITDLGGIPHAQRSQAAQVPLVTARGKAAVSRRAATAVAALTRWHALNPTHSVLSVIPRLILPLVAVFAPFKNTATFDVSKNTADITGATNTATFDVTANVAVIETHTNDADIAPADTNTATIGS